MFIFQIIGKVIAYNDDDYDVLNAVSQSCNKAVKLIDNPLENNNMFHQYHLYEYDEKGIAIGYFQKDYDIYISNMSNDVVEQMQDYRILLKLIKQNIEKIINMDLAALDKNFVELDEKQKERAIKIYKEILNNLAENSNSEANVISMCCKS